MHPSTDPIRVGRTWLFPDGTVLPVIAGGADEGDGDGATTGDGEGDGTEGSTEGTTGDQTAATAEEIAKWKALARKHEKDAKANAAAARELEKVRAQNQSETEKAIEAAKAEGRTEAESRLRERIITAETKALAADTADPDLVAMLLDRTKLVWDGDDLDPASVKAEIARVVKERPVLARKGAPSAATGPRGTEQADLGSMSMDEYVKARRAGANT